MIVMLLSSVPRPVALLPVIPGCYVYYCDGITRSIEAIDGISVCSHERLAVGAPSLHDVPKRQEKEKRALCCSLHLVFILVVLFYASCCRNNLLVFQRETAVS